MRGDKVLRRGCRLSDSNGVGKGCGGWVFFGKDVFFIKERQRKGILGNKKKVSLF